MTKDSILKYDLLLNVHLPLQPPTANGKSYLVNGDFAYYHYKCDERNDVGWGCGYRTLQSICSWIEHQQQSSSSSSPPPSTTVPSLNQIQETLVNISDKPASFLNSREWIGALEVFYVIDTLYDVSCRIQHVAQRDDLKKYVGLLCHHFSEFGGLIMMGGDLDASSKGIAGVHTCDNEAYLLVVDPHFVGVPTSAQELIDAGYVKWQRTCDFMDSSFYNLCLPQLKYTK